MVLWPWKKVQRRGKRRSNDCSIDRNWNSWNLFKFSEIESSEVQTITLVWRLTRIHSHQLSFFFKELELSPAFIRIYAPCLSGHMHLLFSKVSSFALLTSLVLSISSLGTSEQKNKQINLLSVVFFFPFTEREAVNSDWFTRVLLFSGVFLCWCGLVALRLYRI